MNPAPGVGIGQVVPDVALSSPDGAERRLSSFRGRPLLAICVRYYG
jgi:hypothetical protein